MERPDDALPTRASQHPRISSLDGIRALAVLTVVLAHLLFGRAVRSSEYRSLEVLTGNKLGQLGLMFFFVISGFLITLILIEELDRTGRISLGRFYFRRAMRIVPPLYAYVALIAVAAVIGLVKIKSAFFLAALSFTLNYCWVCHDPSGAWFLGHTWTLAVDAQFYLLWPLALVLAGRKRALYVAAAFLVIAPLVRLYQVAQGGHELAAFFGFVGVSDSIAIGCILALLRERLHVTRWYPAFLGSKFFGFVPATAAILVLLSAHPSYLPLRPYVLIVMPFVHLAVGLSLDWTVTYASRPVGKFLNTRILAYLGAMSYSIYLWQMSGILPWQGGKARVLIGVAFIAFASVASYYAIEQPSLRLRKYLERRIFGSAKPRTLRPADSEAAA